MSDTLRADFTKQHAGGPLVHGQLHIPADRFGITVLFGPSGCGKTTVLRALAGLERPETGHITFRGETWFAAAPGQKTVFQPPQQRDIGFLFQEYALFPHLTVEDNVSYGLKACSGREQRAIRARLLERFQVASLEKRYPHQLSGGQQQRVALARVLARRPRLLLLDEPLSALDATLREELRGQLRRLLADFGIPVIVVTHDRLEAMSLGDHLVVMEGGEVRQSGSVPAVFSHPRDFAVARIVGMETIVPGEIVAVAEGMATVHVGRAKDDPHKPAVTLSAVAPAWNGPLVHVCLRADEVLLFRQQHLPMSVRNQFPAVIEWLVPEGPLVRVGLDGGFALSALVTRMACAELGLQEGERVTVAVKASALHLIPRQER